VDLGKLFLAAALSLACLGAQDRPAQRQKNQQKRIDQGVKSGELTRKEAVKLEAREAKLHRDIKRDRKDGGGLTVKEKAKIEARQDNISADIAKEKHDVQKRK
jgi:hypothetical protein